MACDSSKCDYTNPILMRSELEKSLETLKLIEQHCFPCAQIKVCMKAQKHQEEVIKFLEVLKG